MKNKNKLGSVGLIARFKPLHNGSAIMLEYVCKNSDSVKIGLGSCNKYNVRNPFTAEESRDMVDLFLKPKFKNYEFIYVPDFAHIKQYSNGDKWKNFIIEKFGNLDYFITANPYVKELLKDEYDIIRPIEIIPKERWTQVRGTMVRIEMAKGDGYKRLVPEKVGEYLENNNLVERFRKEFGLETLTMLIDTEAKYKKKEDKIKEKLNAMQN